MSKSTADTALWIDGQGHEWTLPEWADHADEHGITWHHRLDGKAIVEGEAWGDGAVLLEPAELRIIDHDTRPDGVVVIELSDGRQVNAGVEAEFGDDPAADTEPETWLYARIVTFGEDGEVATEAELINEQWDGKAPRGFDFTPGGQGGYLTDAGDVVAAVAKALGIDDEA